MTMPPESEYYREEPAYTPPPIEHQPHEFRQEPERGREDLAIASPPPSPASPGSPLASPLASPVTPLDSPTSPASPASPASTSGGIEPISTVPNSPASPTSPTPPVAPSTHQETVREETARAEEHRPVHEEFPPGTTMTSHGEGPGEIAPGEVGAAPPTP